MCFTAHHTSAESTISPNIKSISTGVFMKGGATNFLFIVWMDPNK